VTPCDAALQGVLGLFAYDARWIPCLSDKIAKLKDFETFPMDGRCLEDFNLLKQCIEDSSLQAIDESLPFVFECDASEVAISATLNQSGPPIAFMSRSLSKSEFHYPPVGKEATAIIGNGNGIISWLVAISQLSRIKRSSCLITASARK